MEIQCVNEAAIAPTPLYNYPAAVLPMCLCGGEYTSNHVSTDGRTTDGCISGTGLGWAL